MSERYYISTPIAGGRVTLAGAEAHHLLHVMRACAGTEVTLFDGQGGEYLARVVTCKRSAVELDVGPREEVCREIQTRIALGVALPKGDRQKWLVEKLTELGVSELVPLATERSVADLRGKSRERLDRAVVESSKQCGRNVLMHVAEPQPIAQYLTIAKGTRLIAHPGGQPIAKVLPPVIAEASIVVGPEGGLTETEIAIAVEHGWQSVELGPAILRIETAAVAMAAVIANRR